MGQAVNTKAHQQLQVRLPPSSCPFSVHQHTHRHTPPPQSIPPKAASPRHSPHRRTRGTRLTFHQFQAGATPGADVRALALRVVFLGAGGRVATADDCHTAVGRRGTECVHDASHEHIRIRRGRRKRGSRNRRRIEGSVNIGKCWYTTAPQQPQNNYGCNLRLSAVGKVFKLKDTHRPVPHNRLRAGNCLCKTGGAAAGCTSDGNNGKGGLAAREAGM